MGLLHVGMLFALSALAIPVLIHLLRRRRHEVIAWGAMQFLPASITTRRRRFWDELPLLVVRLATIGLIVLALAGPYSSSAVFAPLADHPPRDTVIILDGSFAMDRRDDAGQTPWTDACQWAATHIAKLGHGERIALLVARRPPLAWQAELTADRGLLQSRVDALPAPRGNPGLPHALAEAWRILDGQSETPEQEIVIVRDRQYHGWADEATRRQWHAVGRALRADAAARQAAGKPVPHLRVVEVARDRARPIPSFALGPLTMSRTLVPMGQAVRIATTLHGVSPEHSPRAVRIQVDGTFSQEVAVPTATVASQVPLTFRQRFDTPGLHVITATIDVAGQADARAADNEQHAVVEVMRELPVLLVGSDTPSGPESSTYFLAKALAPSEKASIVLPHVVAADALAAEQILGTPREARPAVVVLADVPALSAAVQEAIPRYLKEGGGVLVALGPHATGMRELYNDVLYRGGEGWVPARLVGIAGAPERSAARPAAESLQHPALDLFRRGLGDVALPNWWKLDPGDKGAGAVVARLDNGDPLLVEKRYGKGRVLLLGVPVDRSWDSTLPGAWEFPVLMHELIYYLAGARANGWMLGAGEPMRVGPGPHGAVPGRLVLQTPEIPSKTVAVREWPWVEGATGAIGLYRAERADGSRQFFVVPPDLDASADRRCTDDEWTAVLGTLPLTAVAESTYAEPARRHELWWLLLLAVMGLLCVEVLLTRRLALQRRSSPRNGVGRSTTG